MRLETLERRHPVEQFDCGIDALNGFLVRFALQSQQARPSRTYLAIDHDEIAGFMTLSFGSIAHEDAPARIAAGLARHPIPVMIIARLATAISFRRRGIGRAMLRDAMVKAVDASEIAGLRALAVSAKSVEAENFYLGFGFVPSPGVPGQLLLLLKDAIAHLALNPRA